MDIPYNRNKYRKKLNKSNSTITQTQTHTRSENRKNNYKTKGKITNDPKGGSVLENNRQDEKTECISITRKEVDTV